MKKIATFNANSIRSRFGIIIAWLKKEAPDLLCIQETKVQDKDFPSEGFETIGYRTIFRGQKSYNGVAIAAKDPLKNIRMGFDEELDEQSRFISSSVLGIDVMNVYVPQGFAPGTEKFSYKLKWLKNLFLYIKKEYNPDQPILLAGDFNVVLDAKDLYDPETFRGQVGFHPDEQIIFKEFIDWGFVDIFRTYNQEGGQYTFWDYRIPNGFRRNMGWRIDYILVTRPLAEKSVSSWIDKGPRSLEKPSDHTFLVAEFKI